MLALTSGSLARTNSGRISSEPARSRERKEAGFSLIELMIGIVILAIAMVAAMPSYSQWIQNTQIRNAAESVLNGMQRARAEAVSRNVNVAFTLGGGAFWTVTAADGSVLDTKPSAEIPASIVVTPTPDDATTITFGNLGGVVANAGGTPQITRIDIDSSALSAENSRDLRITVGAGGGVRLCDPTVVLETDPRLCP